MTRWLTGWLPLLRIARRDALRARGRSVLILAMIALPVLALTGVDVLARSAQLDPDESLTRTLGATQARLEGASGPVQQAPNPDDGWVDVQSSNASGPGTSDADTAPPEQVDPAVVRVRCLLHRAARALQPGLGGAQRAGQRLVGVQLGGPGEHVDAG